MPALYSRNLRKSALIRRPKLREDVLARSTTAFYRFGIVRLLIHFMMTGRLVSKTENIHRNT